jgi:hypothetical protein
MNVAILLNGPPRAGKDTAANVICAEWPLHARKLGFSAHLKRATHAAYGMPAAPIDQFEPVKDEPREEFFGLTPRQAYIAHSEDYMKPLHGKRIFGRLWLRAAQKVHEPIVVVPDSGFYDEAMVAIDELGARNVLLLRIHAEGRGESFAGDSRSYISLPNVATIDIHNDGTEAKFRAAVLAIVELWLALRA